MDLNLIGGLAMAFLGAGLAVGFSCAGSGKGTGYVGEAATGLIAESPDTFGKCLVLQVIPGTQGLYGLVIWFFALMQIGVLGSGDVATMTFAKGCSVFAACLTMAIVVYMSAAAQGKVAASSVNLMAKNPDHWSKGIIMCVVVEFYAILCLLASIMMLMNVG